MEVERAGGFEEAMQFEQAISHHREIGHHVVLAQKATQGLHHLRHVGVRLVQEFVKFALGLLVPMPGVLEGFNLRLAVIGSSGRESALTRFFLERTDVRCHGRFEEQIVVALGIERRVEINEVNGFVRKMLAEDLEIVAVIELVHWRESVRGKIGGVNSAVATIALGDCVQASAIYSFFSSGISSSGWRRIR